MFGIKGLFKSKDSQNTKTSSNNIPSPTPIFISDYIGVSSVPNTNIPQPYRTVRSDDNKTIRLGELGVYQGRSRELEKIYNHAMVGCNGEFPVTNPIVDGVYYYPAEKRYYKCLAAVASETPNENFEVLKLGTGGGTDIKGIEITGATVGSGTYNNVTKKLEVTTKLGADIQADINSRIINFAKKPTDPMYVDYNNSSNNAIGGYGLRDTNFGQAGGSISGGFSVSDNVSKATSALGIAVNSDGSGETGMYFANKAGEATNVRVTQDKIIFTERNVSTNLSDLLRKTDASKTYLGISAKAASATIADKTVGAYTIKLNGVAQTAFNGSAAVSINITAASIGAQPKGSYAAASHNQASNTITAMTGYTKAGSVAAITPTDTLNVAIGKLEKALDAKQPSGSYAPASHTHDDRYFTESEINSKLGSYSLTSHNHDSVYAKASHGTHVTYATIAGKAAGTAAVGTSAKVAREDHVHPLQTSVSGNAGTATKLQTARTINGVAFDGTKNITITLDASQYYTKAQVDSALGKKFNTTGGTISGALTVTGQILSNADVVAYSDARMKTNVEKIADALDKLDKISGYTYDMQGVEFQGQRQSGVLAQEILEVLPECVRQDDNGYYAVRYTGLIPLLIEAIKEERSKRESLEERLAKIEKMLEMR